MSDEAGAEVQVVAEPPVKPPKEESSPVGKGRRLIYELPAVGIDKSLLDITFRDDQAKRDHSDTTNIYGEKLFRKHAVQLREKGHAEIKEEGYPESHVDTKIPIPDATPTEEQSGLMTDQAKLLAVVAGLRAIGTEDLSNSREVHLITEQTHQRDYVEMDRAGFPENAAAALSLCERVMEQQARQYIVNGEPLSDEEIAKVMSFFRNHIAPLAIARTITNRHEAMVNYPFSEELQQQLSALGHTAIETYDEASHSPKEYPNEKLREGVEKLTNLAWRAVAIASTEGEEARQMDLPIKVDDEWARVARGIPAEDEAMFHVGGLIDTGKETATEIGFSQKKRSERHEVTGSLVGVTKKDFNYTVSRFVGHNLYAGRKEFLNMMDGNLEELKRANGEVNADPGLQRSLAMLTEDFGEALVNNRRGGEYGAVPSGEDIYKLAAAIKAREVVRHLAKQQETNKFLHQERSDMRVRSERADQLAERYADDERSMREEDQRIVGLEKVSPEVEKEYRDKVARHERLREEAIQARELVEIPSASRIPAFDYRRGVARADLNRSMDEYLYWASVYQEAEAAGDGNAKDEANRAMSTAVIFMLEDMQKSEAEARNAGGEWYLNAPMAPGRFLQKGEEIDYDTMYGITKRRDQGSVKPGEFVNAVLGNVPATMLKMVKALNPIG